MSLHAWRNNGWLTPHAPGPQEIANLLAVSKRDLHDSRTEGLSPDWRLNIAYNAALQAATAALAACGYRAERTAHHYRVIQSLVYTIGVTTDVVVKFDYFRKKRNISGYGQAGAVSRQEADEMVELAQQVCECTRKWLNDNHPELMGKAGV